MVAPSGENAIAVMVGKPESVRISAPSDERRRETALLSVAAANWVASAERATGQCSRGVNPANRHTGLLEDTLNRLSSSPLSDMARNSVSERKNGASMPELLASVWYL